MPRAVFRKVFPDQWSFLLGETAVYSFLILLVTGTLLTLWFQPSMTGVVYHGSYLPLRGVRMSQAYASALNISFDVRGGLLLRQIHHWASDVFLAAIMLHMIWVFLHGAYRGPRVFNWLLGILLFTLAMAEALSGNYLPGDLLSGTGVRVAEGILLSIPVVGTYLAFFLFGGQYPGHDIIPRLYVIHVFVLPGLMLALVAAHLLVTFWRKHPRTPGRGRTTRDVVGVPVYPRFVARAGGMFCFTFAVLALLATFAQIDPVWLYGPYTPASASAGSGPEFYLGMLEGAIRVMPNWTWNIAGHTVAWNVFVPAVVVPGLFFTSAAAWPFAERWITGDRAGHHLAVRFRDAPARTGIGMAAITFWGVLWAEGTDDIIAGQLHLSLELITSVAPYATFAGPVVAYLVTKRICLGLQRRDLHLLEHGPETGIIRRLPSGAYVAETRPPSSRERAIIRSRKIKATLPAGRPGAGQDVPPRDLRGGLGSVRERLNRVLTEGVPLTAVNGQGRGHTNGQSPASRRPGGESRLMAPMWREPHTGGGPPVPRRVPGGTRSPLRSACRRADVQVDRVRAACLTCSGDWRNLSPSGGDRPRARDRGRVGLS